ncbi:PEP/pyruvate-binding domain-containing protein [Georgenia yuyongxinii]|uniref:Phosphoenolpyruvate synthase n=1 Tax=Georgenia yuyongxinii TaxID=2589797 RepID=A0A552WWK3_9MICO|nr:PEP/pyruvate-binding domain-containing protein [Georgenia yuyongxinii]TRW46683.1 pyruvate, water dikinase [Georgenia yuyongxinii]
MTDTPFVLPFADPRAKEVSLSGGKGASLATMTAEHLPVPPGFVITSAAFAAAVDEEALRARSRAKDMAGAREIVAAARPPVELVTEHYAQLSGLVAVRSSACAEDSEGASYAGQQETYLNVAGLDAVLEKIVECWLSFFTDRAIFYREEKGSLEDVAMAVVVQQMVDSKKSGVMFTVDPVHQRKDRMVVEAALGLGENVVNGEMTPDHYVLDRKGAIKRSKVVAAPVLAEAESQQLAALGQQLEDLHGCPQDIEWAFDDAGDLFLLQSRPITTV